MLETYRPHPRLEPPSGLDPLGVDPGRPLDGQADAFWWSTQTDAVLDEALGKARSRSGDANSRARLLIAETDRIAKAVDIDQSMVVSDAHGRRYARLTRSGSQLVLRFQPGLDPDVLQELARRVPELYEEIARKS